MTPAHDPLAAVLVIAGLYVLLGVLIWLGYHLRQHPPRRPR